MVAGKGGTGVDGVSVGPVAPGGAMEAEARGEYRRLQPKSFPPRAQRETAEGRYWNGFEKTALVPQVRDTCDRDEETRWFGEDQEPSD